MKPRESHIFEREEHDHYVEEKWCSQRLFDEEQFPGPILDPACGWGRILDAARDHGYKTLGSDIVERGHRGTGEPHPFRRINFLEAIWEGEDWLWWREAASIVSNPPFDIIEEFTKRALSLVQDFHRFGKVALIFPARRLPAATWLERTPLKSILYMNPRPSMPTGAHIESGGKVGSGTQDFCWLVFDHAWRGSPSVRWLRRENPRSKEDRG